jgi:hypothetical protein
VTAQLFDKYHLVVRDHVEFHTLLNNLSMNIFISSLCFALMAVSFDVRRITRKYERNKAVRKSCSVTRQDAHIRYSPYVARLPLGESP